MDKSAKFVLGIFALIAIYGIITTILRSNKKKLYTIGQVYAKSGPGKSGPTYYFKYAIDGKEYQGKIDGLSRWFTNKNGFIFLEVLENDHNDWQYIDFNKVPACVTVSDIPKAGWDSFPSNMNCK